MNVEYCRDASAWDAYVSARADAFHYHHWVWKEVISGTFNHEAHYLAAVNDGAIRGILPLFAIRSHLFGRSLVSVPFFSYGGVLADDAKAQNALLQRAAEIAHDMKAQRVELRQSTTITSGWEERIGKVSMEVPLPTTTDELWKRISTGLRNKIRKAQKSDLRIEWSGPEGVHDFYRIFAINMRNLGTPVYPKLWFEAICRAIPDQIRILTLWDGREAVASAFLMPFRDVLELPWSASVPESRKKYSHVLMYWTFLEWAVQQRFRRMDLGRCTPGGGTYEFKRHWVCEEKPLHWYYWTPPGVTMPDLRPESSRFRLAIEIWKRLPLAVTNNLGPRIVRALP